MKAANHMRLALAMIALAGVFPLLGQFKYEKEERIEPSEVPASAVDFVSSFPFSKAPKWYLETGFNRSSYEAKGKSGKQFLSIEFSREGVFEDLEIDIAKDQIPRQTSEAIRQFLKESLGEFKIRKTQIQYTGPQDAMLEKLRGDSNPQQVVTKYELIISTKIEGSFKKFEYLFDELGKMENRAEVLINMSDNIEY